MKKPDERSSRGSTVLDEGEQSSARFDLAAVRAQFPILKTLVHGKPLVYLDNAATTQKPRAVLESVRRYFETTNANVHRGVHTLSQEATREYEEARGKVARFINAREVREVIFTRGTTEGINLVAASYGRKFLEAGDEIIISALEHHSNIVPWQILCQQTGAVLRVIPMNDAGELLLPEYESLLNSRTKIVSVAHLSNSLGTLNPVEWMIEKAHAVGAVVMIDGAQWVAHGPTDVRALDADFYAFSGHKLYGPTGIGVLYGKAKLLESMDPYQSGGDMISSVTFEKTTYNVIPHKFEAGTPHIVGVISLGVAIDFVESIGFLGIARHEQELLEHAARLVEEIPGVRIVGTAREKGSVLSFVVDEPAMSTLDVGARLDAEGIAVRTGHHCCQPVMDRFGISSTARASFAMYNTKDEVEFFASTLRQIVLAEGKKGARMPQASGSPEQTQLKYPAPAAASPEAAAGELMETFEMLGEWKERYQYVVELGDKLPVMPAELKTEANRVRGCMSTVHLSTRLRPDTAEGLDFLADSDAAIVRGLIAILQRVYAGQSAKAILKFDMTSLLNRLGLDQHLSMGRRNGLAGMIQRITAEAASLARA
jgi:cysteine desulfurase / selenocysteine lyase